MAHLNAMEGSKCDMNFQDVLNVPVEHTPSPSNTPNALERALWISLGLLDLIGLAPALAALQLLNLLLWGVVKDSKYGKPNQPVSQDQNGLDVIRQIESALLAQGFVKESDNDNHNRNFFCFVCFIGFIVSYPEKQWGCLRNGYDGYDQLVGWPIEKHAASCCAGQCDG